MRLPGREKQRLKERYGEWAVVTGATSGIGLELARQVASAGLNVVINARRLAELQTTEADLRREFGVDVRSVNADLSEASGVEKLVQASGDLNVGLLITAAGYGTSGSFANNTLAEETNMLRLNAEAVMLLTHHYGRLFLRQKRGGIILLSSMVAFQGVPYAAHYAATKAYVQSLAEGLAVELKPFGVDVLAAAPGPVDSGFAKRAGMKMGKALKPAEVGVPILQALGRRTTVLPGALTKMLVYSLRTVPRWGKVKIMAKVMKGFTEHQE